MLPVKSVLKLNPFLPVSYGDPHFTYIELMTFSLPTGRLNTHSDELEELFLEPIGQLNLAEKLGLGLDEFW